MPKAAPDTNAVGCLLLLLLLFFFFPSPTSSSSSSSSSSSFSFLSPVLNQQASFNIYRVSFLSVQSTTTSHPPSPTTLPTSSHPIIRPSTHTSTALLRALMLAAAESTFLHLVGVGGWVGGWVGRIETALAG